jgi:hypothetical protein
MEACLEIRNALACILCIPWYRHDGPTKCNLTIPVLQPSVFNISTLTTGDSSIFDPLHDICPGHVLRSRTCPGWARGFAIPSHEAWPMATSPNHLRWYAYCVHKRFLQRTAHQDRIRDDRKGDVESGTHACPPYHRRGVAFWRGSCTTSNTSWTQELQQHAMGLLKDHHMYMTQAMRNKRLQLALMVRLAQ